MPVLQTTKFETSFSSCFASTQEELVLPFSVGILGFLQVELQDTSSTFHGQRLQTSYTGFPARHSKDKFITNQRAPYLPPARMGGACSGRKAYGWEQTWLWLEETALYSWLSAGRESMMPYLLEWLSIRRCRSDFMKQVSAQVQTNLLRGDIITSFIMAYAILAPVLIKLILQSSRGADGFLQPESRKSWALAVEQVTQKAWSGRTASEVKRLVGGKGAMTTACL